MDKFVQNVKFVWNKTNRWHRTLFVLALVESRMLPSSKFGFWCNDPALSHLYTGDTVSWKWLLAVCILLPLPIMLFVEQTYYTQNRQKSKNRALRWYKEYLYGLLMNITLVLVMKNAVGSPRPHFFDTCQPKEAATCTTNEFIHKYTCTKPNWLHQSDQSFPSGHTSLSVHAALFTIWYLWSRAPGVRVAGAVWCGAAAGACAVSRVTDRRHHWWDVAAGGGVGAAILGYTVICKCKTFTSVSDHKTRWVGKQSLKVVDSNESQSPSSSDTTISDT